MVHGLMILITDMSGSPMKLKDSILMAQVAIGYLQYLAGPGSLIIHGAGRRFTMDGGTMTLTTGGFGFPVMNGARHGSPGEDVIIIMDGHPWVRALPSR